MANLTLFGSVEVSRTWWVAWTLRELGLQFNNEPQGHLDPIWKAPAYLGINPNGLVPSIKDGDFVLWESMAINLYLAKKIRSRSLVSRDIGRGGIGIAMEFLGSNPVGSTNACPDGGQSALLSRQRHGALLSQACADVDA